jgi:hypothetical protein
VEPTDLHGPLIRSPRTSAPVNLPIEAITGHAVAGLERLASRSARVAVLTVAGCSTDSGFPDYRDDTGARKRRPPIFYADFVAREDARRRYWARSPAVSHDIRWNSVEYSTGSRSPPRRREASIMFGLRIR